MYKYASSIDNICESLLTSRTLQKLHWNWRKITKLMGFVISSAHCTSPVDGSQLEFFIVMLYLKSWLDQCLVLSSFTSESVMQWCWKFIAFLISNTTATSAGKRSWNIFYTHGCSEGSRHYHCRGKTCQDSAGNLPPYKLVRWDWWGFARRIIHSYSGICYPESGHHFCCWIWNGGSRDICCRAS